MIHGWILNVIGIVSRFPHPKRWRLQLVWLWQLGLPDFLQRTPKGGIGPLFVCFGIQVAQRLKSFLINLNYILSRCPKQMDGVRYWNLTRVNRACWTLC
jgi:hypothetical protein